MKTSVSRRQAREQAFILAFEKNFTSDSVDEILEAARLSDDRQPDDFAVTLVRAMEGKLPEIDCEIQKNIKGWKMGRLSKVSLALLRLSVFQILFVQENRDAENPVSVVINDAVRLAKKYSTPEDAAFINGVLGTIAKHEKCMKLPDTEDKEQ